MHKAECRFCTFVAKGDTERQAFEALAAHVKAHHPEMEEKDERRKGQSASVTPLYPRDHSA